MAAVAAALRPSTGVVEAVGIAVEEAAVETAAVVAVVPDPMAAVVVAVTTVVAAEATVRV
jgi:hypothetical protein